MHRRSLYLRVPHALALGCLSLVLACSETFAVSLGSDRARVEIVADDAQICQGECVDLEARIEGSYEPSTIRWSHGLPDGPGPHRVCPTDDTEYEVTVEDAGSEASAPVTAVLTVNVASCAEPVTDAGGESCDREQCALCIPNSSFEGEPAYARVPDPYVVCDNAPDTRDPSDTQRPTDGNTYLGMDSDSDARDREVASVPLCATLEAGRVYSFAIDLAVEDRDDRTASASFEVWAGRSPCERAELLWTQDLSSSDREWRTYYASFVPKSSHEYITLQASGEAPGYVVLDNLVPCACPSTR